MGMYMYGFGGMLSGSGCLDCGVTETRLDAIYFKEGLSLRFAGKRWIVDLNPGYVSHYEYEIIEKGGSGLDTDKTKKWVADGIRASGSVGIRFPN
jgi:hypothetical protein